MPHHFKLDEDGNLKQDDLITLLREHDEINVQWANYPDQCTGYFYIFEEWEDLERLVQVVNNHVLKHNYGDIRRDNNGIILGLIDSKINTESPYVQPEDELNIDQITRGSWGFSDEYTTCGQCYNIIRTSADSYSWTPDYWIGDGEIICGDCVRSDLSIQENYIENLINNPKSANTILTEYELTENKFERCHCGEDGQLCEFSAGLSGNWDDPEELLTTATTNNPEKEFIFEITAQGQFDTEFTLWSRPIEGSS